MNDTTPVQWGIVGPGAIARTFARGLERSRTGTLVAVGTRNPSKPGLAEQFPGTRIVDGYDALIADAAVDAVYIATPHVSHAEWAIKAIRAGKHVLVEKPIALSSFQAEAVFHEARTAGVFAGEAFMYRLHPQTARLVELVASGAVGEVRLIRSSFGFDMGSVQPEHRLFANDLAGGGILDVGGYPVSMARLIAGAAQGTPVAEPDEVHGAAKLGLTGVDEWASALLHFPSGIVAEVACSILAWQENVLRIVGSQGRIEVADFWFAGGREGGAGRIEIFGNDGTHETVEVADDRWLYAIEADAAGDAIRNGLTQFTWPGMTWTDSIANLRVLDRWRAAVGLQYDVETAPRMTSNLAGQPVLAGSTVPTRAIPGLDKPTSVVALGFEFFERFADASLTMDRFWEAGGNAFDTAWVYGHGTTETIFGDWHTSRQIPRDDIVLIGKGAHSPLVYPDQIHKQLDDSLTRLRTDFVDVYFMHRDDPGVPVGELVDAMDAEVQAGRIRGPFGGSNWSRERLAAAIRHAQDNGRTVPAAMSNNFSLAEMVNPVWDGCVAAADDDWKEWLLTNQVTNFAWSSQGRGFFADSAGRDKLDNEELVRCWYSERNFGRRDRAVELARSLGRAPIHVALAYVVAQPFPVVALIGPRNVAELDDSLSALDIRVTPEQVRWLEG